MKVYILFHSNRRTPEANQIHGVYATKKLAMQAMKIELDDTYDVTMEENEEDHYEYMWMQIQPVKQPKK